jgi:hypothetical protein
MSHHWGIPWWSSTFVFRTMPYEQCEILLWIPTPQLVLSTASWPSLAYKKFAMDTRLHIHRERSESSRHSWASKEQNAAQPNYSQPQHAKTLLNVFLQCDDEIGEVCRSSSDVCEEKWYGEYMTSRESKSTQRNVWEAPACIKIFIQYRINHGSRWSCIGRTRQFFGGRMTSLDTITQHI